MSEFDDNPFADPFAEPSIQQATQQTSTAASSLADYDPFSAAPTAKPAVNNATPQPQQPAVVTPTTMPSDAPPAYTQSAQQQINVADYQRRQEELERKAQELSRREAELRSVSGARENNWPPLPSSFPIQSCFYQDINVDIPLEFQKIVRMLYYLWMFHVLMLVVNVLGGLALFISLGDGGTFGLAVLYLILFSPLSYVCWFRPIYKAFRSDSSINFMVFFFVFFFQLLICIAQAVGIPSIGACGFMYGIRLIVGPTTAGLVDGILCILIGVGWASLACADMLFLAQVHRIYRSTGASMAKAQAEFAQGVLKNEHVQSAASNVASAAVRNQFAAQSPSGSTASSGPRF
ncbi:UNVERIFIED_CONTAM: hypothetical protein RMT77_008845 [Armadillidium vulgare]